MREREPLRPEAKPTREPRELRQARAKKAAETRRKGARKVTMWLDSAGEPYSTESAAIESSRRIAAHKAVHAVVERLDIQSLMAVAADGEEAFSRELEAMLRANLGGLSVAANLLTGDIPDRAV
jgi:hypothetical protein